MSPLYVLIGIIAGFVAGFVLGANWAVNNFANRLLAAAIRSGKFKELGEIVDNLEVPE